MKKVQIEPDPTDKKRYLIINSETGEIVDDANGYGYKSKQSAEKVAWWRFKGGKNKAKSNETKAKKWLKEIKETKNIDIHKKINDLFEMWIKQLATGEITEKELFTDIEIEYGIRIPKHVIKYIKNN